MGGHASLYVLSIKKAAEVKQVSISAIRKAIQFGMLPAHKINGKWKIRHEDLKDYHPTIYKGKRYRCPITGEVRAEQSRDKHYNDQLIATEESIAPKMTIPENGIWDLFEGRKMGWEEQEELRRLRHDNIVLRQIRDDNAKTVLELRDKVLNMATWPECDRVAKLMAKWRKPPIHPANEFEQRVLAILCYDKYIELEAIEQGCRKKIIDWITIYNETKNG